MLQWWNQIMSANADCVTCSITLESQQDHGGKAIFIASDLILKAYILLTNFSFWFEHTFLLILPTKKCHLFPDFVLDNLSVLSEMLLSVTDVTLWVQCPWKLTEHKKLFKRVWRRTEVDQIRPSQTQHRQHMQTAASAPGLKSCANTSPQVCKGERKTQSPRKHARP